MVGHRLALSGAIVASAIAGIVLAAGGGMAVGDAQAASTHASAAGGGRLATITRRKMNRYRARHGRARLRYSRSLTRSARRQALYMARHGFGHRSTIHASRAFRSVGELILQHRGSHARPGTAVSGWANSAPHRVLMLSARYRSVGIGKASSGGRTFWVAHVGRR